MCQTTTQNYFAKSKITKDHATWYWIYKTELKKKLKKLNWPGPLLLQSKNSRMYKLTMC